MTHVTIAGGGLAGLSAALRLAERGYRVKLYESKDVLGGNIASRHVGERVWLDVYPHMYLNWYHNFWALLADVTDADREQLFRPMEGVQWLRRGDLPALPRPQEPVPAAEPAPEPDRRSGAGRGPVPVPVREHRPDGRAAEPDAAARRRERERVPARSPVHDRAHRGVLRRPDRRHLGHPELPRGRRRLPGVPRVQRRRPVAAVLARARLGARPGARAARGQAAGARRRDRARRRRSSAPRARRGA